MRKMIYYTLVTSSDSKMMQVPNTKPNRDQLWNRAASAPKYIPGAVNKTFVKIIIVRMD